MEKVIYLQELRSRPNSHSQSAQSQDSKQVLLPQKLVFFTTTSYLLQPYMVVMTIHWF